MDAFAPDQNTTRRQFGSPEILNKPVYRLYLCLADDYGDVTSKNYPEETTLKELLREMDVAVHMSNVERVELFRILFPGQETEARYLIGELPVPKNKEETHG